MMKIVRLEGNREAREALTLSVVGVLTVMLMFDDAALVLSAARSSNLFGRAKSPKLIDLVYIPANLPCRTELSAWGLHGTKDF